MDIYSNVAAFKAYALARDIDLPADRDDDEFTADLLIASEYLDRTYGAGFSGVKAAGRAQARQWPRIGATAVDGHVFDVNEIPSEIISAVHEVAIRNARSPGSLGGDFTPNRFDQVSVDGAVSVTFSKFATAADAQLQMPAVDAAMSALMTARSSGSSFSGSSARA